VAYLNVEIVLKLAASHIERARELLADHVAKTLSASEVQIEPVFPGLTQGNRARMFTVKLPQTLPRDAVNRLLSDLRADAAIEYAELPAVKHPLSART
jgi:hypothetical protein